MNLQDLFSKYDRLFVFDTETTGLSAKDDQIIEFAAVVVDNIQGVPTVTREYDQLITLDPGTTIPRTITDLTHITNEMVATRGISKEQVCRDIGEMLTDRTLLLAYNANFDLCFTYYLLAKHGNVALLQGKDKLDLLTVYKDRYPYPHKLQNAIFSYGLQDKVQNSHRAVDDVLATVEVMMQMDAEKSDLLNYVNLFGFVPKYGPPKDRIRTVTYKPQPYHQGAPIAPLYLL